MRYYTENNKYVFNKRKSFVSGPRCSLIKFSVYFMFTEKEKKIRNILMRYFCDYLLQQQGINTVGLYHIIPGRPGENGEVSIL
jgi:hypothetical protein